MHVGKKKMLPSKFNHSLWGTVCTFCSRTRALMNLICGFDWLKCCYLYLEVIYAIYLTCNNYGNYYFNKTVLYIVNFIFFFVKLFYFLECLCYQVQTYSIYRISGVFQQVLIKNSDFILHVCIFHLHVFLKFTFSTMQIKFHLQEFERLN